MRPVNSIYDFDVSQSSIRSLQYQNQEAKIAMPRHLGGLFWRSKNFDQ